MKIYELNIEAVGYDDKTNDAVIVMTDSDNITIPINKNGAVSVVAELVPYLDNRDIEWLDVSLSIHDFKANLETTGSIKTTDLFEFVARAQSWYYDDGYGSQELFGTVKFNDGTWLTRGEYDGSEWWEHHSIPETPEWAK